MGGIDFAPASTELGKASRLRDFCQVLSDLADDQGANVVGDCYAAARAATEAPCTHSPAASGDGWDVDFQPPLPEPAVSMASRHSQRERI